MDIKAAYFPTSHMVILYERTSEITHILVDYISESINSNMQVFYIKGDTDTKEIMEGLKYRINLEKALITEQFNILDKSNSYAKGGYFDPENMISLLEQKANYAIESGFSGIAITGELSWTLKIENGFEKILRYECMLNSEIFPTYNISSICRYNINRFSDEMLVNVIETHPFVIWDGKVHENPFYVYINNYQKKNVSNFRVKAWLENISKYTNNASIFTKTVEESKKKAAELQQRMTEELVNSLTYLMEKHSLYTETHNEHVASVARRIAEKMKLSASDVYNCYFAGLVHDIGKILISNDILDKKGLLTKEEFEIIKQHPVLGYDALSKSKELESVALSVLHHHEKWDGTGYPNNLKGQQIPVISRILALADTYDAMTSDRAYRNAFKHDEAIEEIRRCAGTQFDPEITNCFLEVMDTPNRFSRA